MTQTYYLPMFWQIFYLKNLASRKLENLQIKFVLLKQFSQGQGDGLAAFLQEWKEKYFAFMGEKSAVDEGKRRRGE
jgi:hypothetical protein